jgi:hypothetical protein
MLQFKLKGKVAILSPTLTGDENPPKKKEKKTKAQKEARRVTRSGGKKKKKANPKGYVKPRTAEQRAKSMAKAGTRNKPLKAARAAKRAKK